MTASAANSDSSSHSSNRMDFTLGNGAGRRPTHIAASSTVKGHITSPNEIVIAGTIDGEVTSSTRIVVEAGAIVKGAITAPDIHVAGAIQGEVHGGQSVFLSPEADVHGDISSPSLTVEPGATFVGRCFMPTSQGS